MIHQKAKRYQNGEDLAQTLLLQWLRRKTDTSQIKSGYCVSSLSRLNAGTKRRKSVAEIGTVSLTTQDVSISDSAPKPDAIDLSGLSLQNQEFIHLFYYRQMNLSQIALAAGVTTATVINQLRKSRTFLRSKLDASHRQSSSQSLVSELSNGS